MAEVHVVSCSVSASPSAQQGGNPSNNVPLTSCSCKSTCQRRGCCPCKTAGVHCSPERCRCGSQRKPCLNRALPPRAESQSQRPQPIVPTATSTRDTRKREIQEYLRDLDVETCHKVIVEAYCGAGGFQRLRQLVQRPAHPFSQQPQDEDLPWCVCGRCRHMDQPVEQVCCRRRDCCVTSLEAFEIITLDVSVLWVAILNRCEVTGDEPEHTPANYRKAAYRQYIVWQNGYLGAGNRRPVPACVVWAIRDRFPEPSGVYLGFRGYAL